MPDTSDLVKPFRLAYVLMPVVFLVLTVIAIVIFFGQLPETVGFTFDTEGETTRTSGRAGLVFWLIVIHLLATGGAVLVTRTVAWAYNTQIASSSGSKKPDAVIIMMGNELAIPQAVMFFAMMDIFSYNSYGTHLLPLWQNALFVLLAGGLFIGIFVVRYLVQYRKK